MENFPDIHSPHKQPQLGAEDRYLWLLLVSTVSCAALVHSSVLSYSYEYCLPLQIFGYDHSVKVLKDYILYGHLVNTFLKLHMAKTE